MRPGAFAERVAAAEMLIHTGDDPGRDLLEGSADVAFVGGFAAAVEALGGKADLVMLDTTDPDRPRARSLAEAVTRVVRARALNPAFIAGQLRHGPRGAAEFAETVDRLVGFAETTDAVAGALIEAVYAAYVGGRGGAGVPALRKPGRGAGHRRTLRRRAPPRAVASRAATRWTRIWRACWPRRWRARCRHERALRRGACPTLAAPMLTGDGWLARLRVEALTPAQLAGLGQAAGRFGNGRIEVTARGSLQVRGLTRASAADLGVAVADLGIAPEAGVSVLNGPLAGLDPGEIADPRPLAADIRRLAAKLALAPKVSVVVDGGGALPLAAVPADLRLTAGEHGWSVAAAGPGGSERMLALCDSATAVGVVVGMLKRMADARARGRVTSIWWRGRKGRWPPGSRRCRSGASRCAPASRGGSACRSGRPRVRRWRRWRRGRSRSSGRRRVAR